MRWIGMLVILFLGLISLQARAFAPWIPTDVEMRNLPPFCAAKMHPHRNGAAAQNKMWRRRLGHDYMHVHHYCAGLNFLNRYYRSMNAQAQKFDLSNALDNFNYMVGHASPAFVLMPEIYLKRGLVYSLMKRDAKAISDMKMAQQLNPKLIQAYLALADYYLNNKQKKRALKAVIEGLKYNPDSRVLKHRYDRLGGQKPYPKPYAAAEESQANNANAGSEKVGDVASQAAASQQAAEPASSKKTGDSINVQDAKQPTKPTIGTPTNPYCRFCPPE